MQRLLLILGLIITYLLGRLAVAGDHIQSGTSFWLNKVNIVDVLHQRILPDKRILVRDGIIQRVVDSDTHGLPEADAHVDGKGGFVTPGLIDMHVHMYERQAFAFTLSHGITHVRIMNGVKPQLGWRDALATGEMVGSTASVSSPIISGYMGAFYHHGVETPEQAIAAVTQYKNEGYDLIKVYGNLSEPAFAALMQQSRALNIPVAKHAPHVPGQLAIEDYVDMQSFEHVEDIYQGPLNYQLDAQALKTVVKRLKSAQVTITPTLNIYDQLTQLSVHKTDYLQDLPVSYLSTIIAYDDKQNQVKRWLDASDKMAAHNQQVLSFLLRITRELDAADVPLLIGSDSGVLLSPHGLATHNEMRLFREAGIEPYRILRAATLNPARVLGLGAQLGQIADGFEADFILTQHNPIDDLNRLEHPDAVIKAGIWYDQNALSAMRQNAIDSRSIWSEVGVFAEMMQRAD